MLSWFQSAPTFGPNQNHHRRRGDEPADDSSADCARAGTVRQARHRSAHRLDQRRADLGRQSHLRRSRSRLHRRHLGAGRGGARTVPKNSLLDLQQAHSYDARQPESQDRRAIARQTFRHPEHGRHHLDAHHPRPRTCRSRRQTRQHQHTDDRRLGADRPSAGGRPDRCCGARWRAGAAADQ